MSTPDFEEMLNQSADDIKPPQPIPGGAYSLRVSTEQPTFDKSSKKGTPYVEYILYPTAPHDDVDEDLLAEVENWQQKSLKATFYLSQNALFMFKEFCEKCGVQTEGRILKELVSEVLGCEVGGNVKVGINNETGRQYNEKVDQFFPLDD
jgi:hypothetical protein